jgi:ketosteroid isomerase-like protein
MRDFSDLPSDDQQAIGKTLLTLLASFRNRDAVALHAVYSDDDNFNRGQPEGPPETSFRVLTPEVVLVSAYLDIKGQGVVGGGTLDRDNFSLRALQRQIDGLWLIVSEMFQDANTEATYAQ